MGGERGSSGRESEILLIWPSGMEDWIIAQAVCVKTEG